MWKAYLHVLKEKVPDAIIRFADDLICCFQYSDDANRCLSVLKSKLHKFNLELSETKTRLIRFTRFILCNNESFIFLGFEFRWEIARSGKEVKACNPIN